MTELRIDSFAAKKRVKLHRLLRDYGVSITSGLVVAAIVAAFAAHGGKANREVAPPERLPDLGPNITSLSQSLSATRKSWELLIKDAHHDVEMTIKGNQQDDDKGDDKGLPRAIKRITNHVYPL